MKAKFIPKAVLRRDLVKGAQVICGINNLRVSKAVYAHMDRVVNNEIARMLRYDVIGNTLIVRENDE